MVSPEQIENQKPEQEQAPDPAEEQQMPPASEKKWPWLEPLLRGVVIVVSLISGGVFYWLVVVSKLPSIENPPSNRLGFLELTVFLLVCCVALGGAVLFRSYWAIPVVLSAISLGAYIVSTQIAKFFPTITGETSRYMVFGGAAMEWWIVMPILVVLSASLGSWLGVLWKRGGKYEQQL